ncbi:MULTISPECIES: class I SAM-dependent methyltransferase [Lysinibacillus]|uniref:Methyltransferase domain-containing protein n=1 Tax=Lysinibacillus antri TaxID=2498145 RepID=A0A432LI96_9BACI|nr:MULTISPECIES: class I SAM-dependent methyltransferase [Lysinibacillus]RUL56545.1 methyltransferase domain-containing protein [Lysinibacillus antri]TSI03045.1 methyltransferase domain-containing protein [Lysinibacillus sp. BW-2-10]
MKLQRVLQYAQTLLSQSIKEGEIAVDATAGNGHDTLFLAQLVGNEGQVFAFDIQQQAVTATMNRLTEHGVLQRAQVILDGHQHISNYVNQEVAGAIFNLGYLPGADHEIVTQGNTTVQAIEQLLSLLKIGGIIILVVYHGHEGGKEERDEVLHYVRSLPQKYVHVLRYEFINQKNDPPFIVALEKVKELPPSE